MEQQPQKSVLSVLPIPGGSPALTSTTTSSQGRAGTHLCPPALSPAGLGRDSSALGILGAPTQSPEGLRLQNPLSTHPRCVRCQSLG